MLFITIHRLIIGFAKDPSQPAWKGYFYAIILFITAVLQSLFLQQYFFICTRVGMNIRSAVMSAVYKKVSVMTYSSPLA